MEVGDDAFKDRNETDRRLPERLMTYVVVARKLS